MLDSQAKFQNGQLCGSPRFTGETFTTQCERGEQQHQYSSHVAEEQGDRDSHDSAAHDILAIFNERYEGELLLQDTTYVATSPFLVPFSAAYAATGLIGVVPIRSRMSLQAGVKNLLDRNYSYTAGYPEKGRNCFFNFRYKF